LPPRAGSSSLLLALGYLAKPIRVHSRPFAVRKQSVPTVKYAPQQHHDFLAKGDYEIGYLPYNWGLNDQGDQGTQYGWIQIVWDWIRNFIQFWK
jgi:hypothetical protein